MDIRTYKDGKKERKNEQNDRGQLQNRGSKSDDQFQTKGAPNKDQIDV